MLTRKIGGFLRGNATPFQIYAACLLGALIGFAPPTELGPGLVLSYLALLLVLNANLLLAALATVLCRMLAIALAPVAFGIGRVLIDGPTQPLFEFLVNTPVLAWFGFDVYVTPGGIVLALVSGGGMGFVITTVLTQFRRRMAKLEEGSERYKKYSSKGSVKLLAWLLIGGGSKKSFAKLSERRVGNPIRVVGVVLVVLMGALLFIVQAFFAGPIATYIAQRELERFNGATVDVQEVSLDLRGGKAVVRGLAMADANDLQRDILRAETVDIDISNTELLRRRVSFNLIELSGASSGMERRTPGVLVRPIPEAPEPPPVEGEGEPRTIEDYIAAAREWKDRLTKLRDWLDRVSGPDPEAEQPGVDPDEARRDRVRREVAASGHRSVRATHLIDDVPTATIERLVSRGVRVAQLGDETVDVEANDLSTQPWLNEGSPRVTVKSSGGTLDADIDLAGAARGDARNSVRFALRNLDSEAVANQLVERDPPLLSGGTVDLLIDGTWLGAFGRDVDMTLAVTPIGATIAPPGLEPTRIERFTLPIGLTGPINNPRVAIADDAVQQALIEAGRGELARRLDEALGGALGEDASGAIDGVIGEGGTDKVKDAVGGALGDLFGGNKKKEEDRDDEK